MPLQMNIKLDGIAGDSKDYSHRAWAMEGLFFQRIK